MQNGCSQHRQLTSIDDRLRLHDRKPGGGTIYIGAKAPASPAGVKRLVWYEEYVDITDAVQRETLLKRWKIGLIEKSKSGMV